MTFSVRRLGADDLAIYRQLRLEALTVSPTSFGSDFAREAGFSDGQWLERLTTNITAGVFDDGKPIGIATFARHPGLKEQHRGDIYGVYVKAEARGTGASRLLLEKLIALAPTGLVQIHLTVTAINGTAVRFYQRLGFEIYGTEPRSLFVDGRYYDEHLMVLRLDGGRPESDK